MPQVTQNEGTAVYIITTNLIQNSLSSVNEQK